MRGETMNRHPIKINAISHESLNAASRINFSKVYTVEHNLKVKQIGKVDDQYLSWVEYYHQQSTRSRNVTEPPAPTKDEEEGEYENP
jgi:hypothetical protein